MNTIQRFQALAALWLSLGTSWAACSTPTRPSNLIDTQSEVARSGKFSGWAWTDGARAGSILVVEGLVKDIHEPVVSLNADKTKATIGSGALRIVANVVEFRASQSGTELAYGNLRACTPHALLIRNITSCEDPWRVVRFRTGGGCENQPASLRFPATSKGTAVTENPPGTFSVDERNLFDATFAVSDPDWPFQAITYRLDDASVQRGVRYEVARQVDRPDTLRLYWPTLEGDGQRPVTCTVIMEQFRTVSASGTPVRVRTSESKVTLNVARKNNDTPVITGLKNPALYSVVENDTTAPLSIDLAVEDRDNPPGLKFSLSSFPPGMTISKNGVITWSPSEEQAPASYDVVGQCEDEDGDPARGARRVPFAIRVVALEANSPPFFTELPPKEVYLAEGETRKWSIRGKDNDRPEQALTASLVAQYPGATITPTGDLAITGGRLEWGSKVAIQIALEDSWPTPARCLETLQVIINHAPTTESLGSQVVNEESPFRITIPARDGDVPKQSLRFSKIAGPATMKVDEATGLVTWETNEDDGPGSWLVRIRISDNGTPSLSVTNEFRLSVNEVNKAPFIAAIQRRVTEGLAQPIGLDANDNGDRPPQTLTYTAGKPDPYSPSLVIRVNSQTGEMVVTSGEEDGGKTFKVPITVTDNGVPKLSSTSVLTLVVDEFNSAPIISMPVTVIITAETPWNYTPSSRDNDLPEQSLTYSLTLGSPTATGLKINEKTGLLTWKPTAKQAGKTYPIYVKVADSGKPSLSGTVEARIKVNPKPGGRAIGMRVGSVLEQPINRLTLEADGDQMVLRWPPEAGALQVEASPVWPPRWESHPGIPDFMEDAWQMRIDAGPRKQFFRLVDPESDK